MSRGEVTLRLEPLEATTKQGEKIGVKLIFVGGTYDTTLVLPAGADPSGVLAYHLTDVASAHAREARASDPRSFAADALRPLAAGASIEVVHAELEFERPEGWTPVLPAGRYRIVGTYDEGKALRPANR